MTVRFTDFEAMFSQATGNSSYDYQKQLAKAQPLPQLLDVPTGLGKTAAAIIAWVWRRRSDDDTIRQATPRRLVYCLPMRVLVEQTYSEAIRWLARLGLLGGKAKWSEVDADGWPTTTARLEDYIPDPLNDKIAVHLLMGGEEMTDWTLWPERDAILIGTQDMLLSRALNRGYAASRASWPADFGLLTNDCLWVLDEVQLMGSGLATTAQLNAWLHDGKQMPGFGRFGECHFLWMSATMQSTWLETVDHAAPTAPPSGLSADEWAGVATPGGRRLHACKTLQRAATAWEKKPTALAREILEAHRAAAIGESQPAMTLVVMNTVERAVTLQREIAKISEKNGLSEDLLLLHSRFRPMERLRQIQCLLSPPPAAGRIVIATQVIEAGVDISAKIMFTELAPWPSLVQRFGRCNRKGEYVETRIFWLDVAEKDAMPYLAEDLAAARDVLTDPELCEVGATALGAYFKSLSAARIQQLFVYRTRNVIRRRDLTDLFDTTPDLAGNDIDISRYIREGEDHDVQVFWRKIPKGGSPDNPPQPSARREELCPAPVGQARDFLKRGSQAWRWDFLESCWVRARADQLSPGQMLLFATEAGGYSNTIGWDVSERTEVREMPLAATAATEGMDSDVPGRWQTVAAHTEDVLAELETMLAASIDGLPNDALRLAVRWHDRGKAHPAFQAKLTQTARQSAEALKIQEQSGEQIGKAPNTAWRRGDWPAKWDKADGYRRFFRHELASALAVLQAPSAMIPDDLRDLVAYLVAAHHGKVRLSLRSMPGEFRPGDSTSRFARGVWEGDRLPGTMLGGGMLAPEALLNLEPMELGLSAAGRPSWSERMLRLRDDGRLGPFRLAYLEALIRAADRRASAKAERTKDDHHA